MTKVRGAALLVIVMLSAAAPSYGAPTVTLRLATWQWEDPAYAPFWRGSVDEFMRENPGVRIVPFNFPIDQLWDKLNTELAANTPPDLIELTGFNVFEYIARGALEPLDAHLKGTDVEKEFMQQNYARRDGKLWAVSLSARTLQLYLNMKLLRERNMATPTTLDEFRKTCIALTEPSRNQFGFVGVTLPHSRFYELLLIFTAAHGGHFAQNGRPTINAPATVQGMRYFKELFDAGCIPRGVRDAGSQYAWFNSGRAAMSIDGAWYWAILVSQAVPEVLANVKVAHLPTPNRLTTGGVNNLIAVAAASPNKREAVAYIKFITGNPKWGRIWVDNSRTIFMRKGSVTPEFLKSNPWFPVFNEAVANAIQLPPPGLEVRYTEIQKVIVDRATQILYENRPIQQMLDEAQREVEALLKR
jgi:multiple sugar transport system substrate-binding protein